MPARPIVYHIPLCPFSQRLEILLALKEEPDVVDFRTVDITKPRDPELLRKTRGTTALPILELPTGEILKESLVILRYLDETVGTPVRQANPIRHAVENMLIATEASLVGAGYKLLMNRDYPARGTLLSRLLDVFRDLNGFLDHHSPKGPFLFEEFGLAEVVFTPIFARFWFLQYYEQFELPQEDGYRRVRAWRDACLQHPCAQQVEMEEIVKLYYDYALGAGNGSVVPGRKHSSFSFEPHWSTRPWPSPDKYRLSLSDAELGLI